MDTKTVADELVAMWKRGEWMASGEKYWADDVASIEPMTGEMAQLRGKDAVRGKSQWWEANHEVHSAQVAGPYVNGDQFIVRFTMDMTPKESGQRMTMDETAIYTIKDGKISEERFFHAG